jgi:hypothetical protein
LESAEERERLRNLHQTGVLREKEILEQHESLRLRLNSDTLAQLDNLIESAKDKSDAWLIEYQRRFPPIEPNQFRLGGTERRNLERTYMKLSTVEELPPFNEFVGIVNQVATYIRDYKLNTVIEVDQLAIERTTDASVLRTDIRNLKETCNQELSMIRNGRLMLALRRAIERGLKQKRVTSKEIQPLRKIIDRFEGREIDLALSYLNIAADTIAAPFFSLRLTSRNNVLDRAKSRAVSALGVSHRTDVHTTSEISLALHEARENYYSIAVERSLLGQLRRGGTINEIQTQVKMRLFTILHAQ